MHEYTASDSDGSDCKDDGHSRGLALRIPKVEQIMFSSLILECLLCCFRKMVKHYMYISEFISYIGMQQFVYCLKISSVGDYEDMRKSSQCSWSYGQDVERRTALAEAIVCKI